MAMFDKYDPYSGGFRAALAADWLPADVNKAIGVGLDVDGLIVKGDGETGVVGVMVLTKARKVGEIVDAMTSGEIVEAGLDPGTVYYASGTDGVLTKVASAGATRVGHTVEGNRLIVRVIGKDAA